MHKISRKMMLIRRVLKLKRRVEVDTQRMRGNALKKLEKLFGLAVAFKEVQPL